MGNSIANPFKSTINRWFPRKQFQILMLGLSSAGTTTTLYRLRNDNTLDESVTASPNSGFNIVTVPYKKKLNFTLWDVSVSAKDTIRPLWRHFLVNTDAVMFVVDSSDRDGIRQARNTLHELFSDNAGDDGLTIPGECILLVLANKQDLPNSMNAVEMADKLSLHDLKQHKWLIQPACALTGEGLFEGFHWVCSQIVGEESGGSGSGDGSIAVSDDA